tara:strand:- start:1147 stop:1551 length:405 start_codon:yes stop_codon:yes gene_type:complete
MNLDILFVALSLLMLKHYIVDYLWHTPYERVNSATLFHPAMWQHGGKHVMLSAVPYAMITFAWPWWTAVLLIELASHMLIDWTATLARNKGDWQCQLDKEFWWLQGLRQAAHNFVYLFNVALLFNFAPIGFQGL